MHKKCSAWLSSTLTCTHGPEAFGPFTPEISYKKSFPAHSLYAGTPAPVHCGGRTEMLCLPVEVSIALFAVHHQASQADGHIPFSLRNNVMPYCRHNPADV